MIYKTTVECIKCGCTSTSLMNKETPLSEAISEFEDSLLEQGWTAEVIDITSHEDEWKRFKRSGYWVCPKCSKKRRTADKRRLEKSRGRK